MNSALRTVARPPQMRLAPLNWPLSNACGARPARLATSRRLSVPISGSSARIAWAVSAPTPGAESRIAALFFQSGSPSTNFGDLLFDLGDLALQRADQVLDALGHVRLRGLLRAVE